MRGMRRKRRRSCRYLPPARTHALGRATESQLVQPVPSNAMQREKRPQAVSALVHCAAVHAALPEIPRSVAVRSAHARCRPTRLDRANKSRALVHMIGSRWIVCRADVKYLRTSIVNRGEARWAVGAGHKAMPFPQLLFLEHDVRVHVGGGWERATPLDDLDVPARLCDGVRHRITPECAVECSRE